MKPTSPSAGKGRSKLPVAFKALPEPKVDSAEIFPIVGIGASAGGLAAFEAFFNGMPADVDPGMAFVLVQHLAPDHKSILADLIRRYTRMKVYEVEDGMKVEINSAYIIPPGRDMAFQNGALQLLEPSASRGHRLPIDFFFRSLALDRKERAIGIVLSGTGSDGTVGLRAIKAEGGMAMAQTPGSTKFDGMPRSAIATGLVDFELPPVDMPAQLMAYAGHTFSKRRSEEVVPVVEEGNALKKVFFLLRTHTGHDFSLYKPTTIHRRIERRMAVHQIESVEDYVKFMRQSSVEIDALFRDLLIGVTNFFRDPEIFQTLEREVIPRLFAGKPAGDAIRVWTTGCSTGEEAYSLAILLLEHMEELNQNYTVQIFATDIDRQAIMAARAGLYPASISVDISAERLARFFSAEPDGNTYRINKTIRDLLVFSEQDLIKDPPFSKMDLITCRNLLIYLGPELQRKLIPLFYYSLKPNGWLFLGASEGIGEFDELFDVFDRKAKLYQRKTDRGGLLKTGFGRFLPSLSDLQRSLPHGAAKRERGGQTSLRELTESALLSQVIAAGALVNARGDILYLHGRSGLFLEMVPGEAGINNVLKMAREGLSRELASTFSKAKATQNTVFSPGLRVESNGHAVVVNLTIRPVVMGSETTGGAPHFLVVFEEVNISANELANASPQPQLTEKSHPDGSDSTAQDVEARIAALKLELREKETYLQSTVEDLESSAEELKSASEEMQSVNEELQSTNEELETSKEELQSVNEELATVNTELQIKVSDLSRANNDMNNLLAGTGIGTVFVDHELRILRFTPAVRTIINLISTDVGRPVSHIVSNLVGYDSLVADVQAVLDTLVSREVPVRTLDGKHYFMRLQPYRTLENVIEGAVISFVDITEMVKTREALEIANDLGRLAVVVRDGHDAITVQDLEGRILAWNPSAVRLYGWSEAEALSMNVRDRIPEDLRAGALTTLAQLSRAEILESYRTQRLTKTGAIVEVFVVSTAMMNESHEMYAIATTERAIEQGAP